MENSRTNPLTWLGIALVVAIALMAIFGAITMWTWHGGYAGGDYGMMGGSNWGWAAVMMVVPAVILVVLLVAVLVGTREPVATGTPAPTSSPLEILDARYARNEVSRDDYLRIRSDLMERERKP